MSAYKLSISTSSCDHTSSNKKNSKTKTQKREKTNKRQTKQNLRSRGKSHASPYGGVSRIRWNDVDDVLLRPSTCLTTYYCDFLHV